MFSLLRSTELRDLLVIVAMGTDQQRVLFCVSVKDLNNGSRKCRFWCFTISPRRRRGGALRGWFGSDSDVCVEHLNLEI